MADNFTQNQVQGVFGKFKPILDDAITGGDFSGDNVQGVFGEFKPVLDEAAGVVGVTTRRYTLPVLGVG